ncbi:flavin-containing monooxygenase [Nocardioides sp. NPDC051685]|uniref:flavin-containing monooxygenase n=1 Tax=Nocardioides sp. NPDC051685 TaxID=3364334 RepID=UPI0037A9A989
MTDEQQAAARRSSFNALRSLRDTGSIEVPELSENRLRDLMTFIAGDAAEAYLPLLKHEIDIPAGVGSPSWSKTSMDEGRPFRVAIIGAGMSGLAAAYRLQEAGVECEVFEKNPEVGGTWYENRYPGCQLDTSNFAYSFSFLQTGRWTHQYSRRDAIFAYFRDASEQLGLRPLITFDTAVEAARYRSGTHDWEVRTRSVDGTRRVKTFNAVISAVGQLNTPLVPEFPHAERFRGTTVHTARWDDDLDLAGKRVAVIGTGASAFQLIPAIADSVEELFVFQRNAPWMYPTPNYHDAIPEACQWLFDVLPLYHRWFRFFQFWTSVEGRRRFVTVDPEWDRPGSVSAANESMRVALTDYLAEQFGDRPDLLEHVIPHYPPGAKRLLRDDGAWASTLKRPDVHLVSDQITEFTETGIRTEDGTHVDVDVIVYGTGFRASEFLESVVVTGEDDLTLAEYWAGDARAYLGITVPKFPNLFCLYGPNTNVVVNGSIVLLSELGVDYILDSLRHLLSEGHDAMRVREEPFIAYNQRIDRANSGMAWGASAVSSWYKNSRGRVSQNWPLPLLDYWNLTRAVRADDYDFLDARATVDVGGTRR